MTVTFVSHSFTYDKPQGIIKFFHGLKTEFRNI